MAGVRPKIMMYSATNFIAFALNSDVSTLIDCSILARPMASDGASFPPALSFK